MNISYQDTAVSGGMVSLFSSSDATQPFSTALFVGHLPSD